MARHGGPAASRDAPFLLSRLSLWATHLRRAALWDGGSLRASHAPARSAPLPGGAPSRRRGRISPLPRTPSPNWSGHLGEVMLNLFEEEENGGISQGRRWAPAVHDRLQEGADRPRPPGRDYAF